MIPWSPWPPWCRVTGSIYPTSGSPLPMVVVPHLSSLPWTGRFNSLVLGGTRGMPEGHSKDTQRVYECMRDGDASVSLWSGSE